MGKHGFYSIVQKGPEAYHVRGRLRGDLENLLQLIGREYEIHEWSSADYRFRIIVDQAGVAAIMAALAVSLDYPNFKNQIAREPDQQVKLDAFHRVWAIMAALQES